MQLKRRALGPALETSIRRGPHRAYDCFVVKVGQPLQSRKQVVHAQGGRWDSATAATARAEKQPKNVFGERAVRGCNYADFLQLVPTKRLAGAIGTLVNNGLVRELDGRAARPRGATEEIEETYRSLVLAVAILNLAHHGGDGGGVNAGCLQ